MQQIDAIFGRRFAPSAWLILMAALGMLACAPKQLVPLDVGPGTVQVFVDGKAVEAPVPEQLDLYSNRGHVIFVKRPGYRAQQVVLHSVEQPEGPAKLEPETIVEVAWRTLEGDEEPRLSKPPLWDGQAGGRAAALLKEWVELLAETERAAPAGG